MKFQTISPCWVTTFPTNDISFGLHICWKGRIDVHFLIFMISIGNVPIYKRNGKFIAVSNSYHTDKTKPVRAGTPD